MDLYKQALACELKGLMETWERLQVNKAATERDYSRIREKINGVCSLLNEIERKEKSNE